VTKSVVDRRMLVLVLCGWLGGSPAIAASPKPRPLIKRVNAALCNSPDVIEISRIPASDVTTPRIGYAYADGVYATAASLLRDSQSESKPMNQIAALSRAITLAPNYQKAYRQRASLYESEQQFDLAIADYDRAFQLQPDNFTLIAAQGLLYGDLQEWKKLIAVYDRLHSIRPALAAHYHTIQARAYAELRQWPEVIQQYTIAIQGQQLKTEVSAVNLDWYAHDGEQIIGGQWEAYKTPRFVTQLADRMVLWDDPSGKALLYLNRGYAYERQNQTQLANVDYALAFSSVKQLPSSVEELYRSRCRLKVWAGDMTGAKSDANLATKSFQASQAQQPKLPPLMPELSPPLPRVFAQPPISLKPPISESISPPMGDGKPATEEEMSDVNRRSVMEKNVELGIPPEYFDPAMPMDRDFAPAYYHRGIWRLQTEQFESVLADFDRAIALNPQFSLAHAARGEALQRLKRSDEAMAALDQALKLDPTLAAARFSQGMLWLERGDAKQAESAFDDVLMIDPESIKALTERSKIRRLRQDIVGSTADDRRVKQVRDRWNLPL
jgi:tetratricopeptide (TPR) repeat protein